MLSWCALFSIALVLLNFSTPILSPNFNVEFQHTIYVYPDGSIVVSNDHVVDLNYSSVLEGLSELGFNMTGYTAYVNTTDNVGVENTTYTMDRLNVTDYGSELNTTLDLGVNLSEIFSNITINEDLNDTSGYNVSINELFTNITMDVLSSILFNNTILSDLASTISDHVNETLVGSGVMYVANNTRLDLFLLLHTTIYPDGSVMRIIGVGSMVNKTTIEKLAVVAYYGNPEWTEKILLGDVIVVKGPVTLPQYLELLSNTTQYILENIYPPSTEPTTNSLREMYSRLQISLEEIRNYIVENTSYTNTTILESIITPFDPLHIAVLIVAYTLIALTIYPLLEYVFHRWLGILTLYSGTIEYYMWIPTWWGFRKWYFWAEPRIVLGDLLYSYDEILVQLCSGILKVTRFRDLPDALSFFTGWYWSVIDEAFDEVCINDLLQQMYALAYGMLKIVYYGLVSVAEGFSDGNIVDALSRLSALVKKSIEYMVTYSHSKLVKLIYVIAKATRDYLRSYLDVGYDVVVALSSLGIPLADPIAIAFCGIPKAWYFLNAGIDSGYIGAVLPRL